MSARRALLRVLLACGLCWAAQPSLAETYPSRPIKIVVAFPPGGTADIVGRLIAQELSRNLGQNVYVENKGGAGGLVGTEDVARSEPNGYTLLLGNSGALATSLSLYPHIRYDVMRDFAPVSLVAEVPIVLAARTGLPAQNVAELISLAKAKPGALNVAVPAIGSIHHLLTELFKIKADVQLTNVPYKGSGPAVLDLVAGRVDIDFDNLPALISFVQSGHVRGLAVASSQRVPLLPDLPTLSEAGLPSLTASPWFVLVAPAGTPAPVIEKLNTEVVSIMRSPAMLQKLQQQGASPLWSTPDDARDFIQSEIKKWGEVVRSAGIKVE